MELLSIFYVVWFTWISKSKSRYNFLVNYFVWNGESYTLDSMAKKGYNGYNRNGGFYYGC